MQCHAMHVSLLSLLWETQQRTSAESEYDFSMQQFEQCVVMRAQLLQVQHVH